MVIVAQLGKFEFSVSIPFWVWLLHFLCETIYISVGNFIRSMVEVWISIATVVLEKIAAKWIRHGADRTSRIQPRAAN